MLNDEIIRSARHAILSRARLIRQARYDDVIARQFSSHQIHTGEAAHSVGLWLEQALTGRIANPVLYSLSVDSLETAQTIKSAFDNLPNEETRGYRLPRRNPDNPRQTVLYVGGSGNIRRRLKEHLDAAHARTYAMNLRKWCPAFEGAITVKVQAFSPDVSRECRQDIEDSLWANLKPIFGKSGAR